MSKLLVCYTPVIHDLVVLVLYRQENCTNQPATTHLPELLVFILFSEIKSFFMIIFYLCYLVVCLFICYSVGIAWLFSIRLLHIWNYTMM